MRKNKMNRKTQTFVVAFAIMLTLTFVVSTAYGQKKALRQQFNSPENGNSIVGTWVAIVTMRNCETGAAIRSFPVMNTFNQGGTMMESSRSLATRSPGMGMWERNIGNDYSSIFMFFRSNADGTDNGYQKVQRRHTLNNGILTTTATFENFNAAGVLTSTGCATETASRLTK